MAGRCDDSPPDHQDIDDVKEAISEKKKKEALQQCNPAPDYYGSHRQQPPREKPLPPCDPAPDNHTTYGHRSRHQDTTSGSVRGRAPDHPQQQRPDGNVSD